jgi:hypothetical protein
MRFRLRTLLIAMAVVPVVAGWLSWRIQDGSIVDLLAFGLNAMLWGFEIVLIAVIFRKLADAAHSAR